MPPSNMLSDDMEDHVAAVLTGATAIIGRKDVKIFCGLPHDNRTRFVARRAGSGIREGGLAASAATAVVMEAVRQRPWHLPSDMRCIAINTPMNIGVQAVRKFARASPRFMINSLISPRTNNSIGYGSTVTRPVSAFLRAMQALQRISFRSISFLHELHDTLVASESNP